MVHLPGLEQYTEEQLQAARSVSPAFFRYENLIKNLPPSDLHHRRHRAWMECVLATYTQKVSTQEVCQSWSETADELLKLIWEESGLGRVSAVLLALGKHGSMELNLSSDIDLIIVAETKDGEAVEKGLRHFQKRLHEVGDQGLCYRLDFDLRPGGKLGPMITTPSQFQDYYWSQGETWERLALVRMRPVCGAQALSEQITDLATRFSYRKFLDFTLLEDLKALRSQVHQRGFQRFENELHLKLEVGGIRDIELFIHSLMILNGGKLPAIRTRSTGQALENLANHKLLTENEAESLLKYYWHFRHVENLVQSVNDQQTHIFTNNMPDLPTLPTRQTLEVKMKHVDQIVSTLLGAVDLKILRLPTEEGAQHDWLRALGFDEITIETVWNQVVQATALSHKNDRDERARKEFLYTFVTELARNSTMDRDLGLRLLVDFVYATRAKATFFSMLLRTPKLIQDLARLFCLSPYLGSILVARPELLDHFILHVDEDWAVEMDALLEQMGERKLLTELWSANQYLGDKNLTQLFTRISHTADEVTRQLLARLRQEFPASKMEILTLGKWGGKELGLRSDLDFIFVTPEPPEEADFKVARRFISRLTDPAKAGNLYDLDLRLRPSGQSGPLLVDQKRLTHYWSDMAKAWERQAYLRSRLLNPGMKIDKMLLVDKKMRPEDLNELKDIRSKLLKPTKEDAVDIKYAPGGMLDIEFVTQTAMLAYQIPPDSTSTIGMIDLLAKQVPAWEAVQSKLKSVYMRLREFEQMLKLSSANKDSEVKRNQPVWANTALLLNLNSDLAWAELNAVLKNSRTLLNDLDPTGLRF